MVKKLRVSLALQPVATALFANSPFTEGKPNGFLSFRSEIWRDTDADRSGMLPWAFEPGMGFERWVDYALDVPMYFVKRGDTYIDVAGQSFRDLLAGHARRLCRASAPPCPTGRTTSPPSSPRCGSSVISRCAAPTPVRGATCPRSPRSGSGCSMTDLSRRGLGPLQGLDGRGAADAAGRGPAPRPQRDHPRAQPARMGDGLPRPRPGGSRPPSPPRLVRPRRDAPPRSAARDRRRRPYRRRGDAGEIPRRLGWFRRSGFHRIRVLIRHAQGSARVYKRGEPRLPPPFPLRCMRVRVGRESDFDR